MCRINDDGIWGSTVQLLTFFLNFLSRLRRREEERRARALRRWFTAALTSTLTHSNNEPTHGRSGPERWELREQWSLNENASWRFVLYFAIRVQQLPPIIKLELYYQIFAFGAIKELLWDQTFQVCTLYVQILRCQSAFSCQSTCTSVHANKDQYKWLTFSVYILHIALLSANHHPGGRIKRCEIGKIVT